MDYRANEIGFVGRYMRVVQDLLPPLARKVYKHVRPRTRLTGNHLFDGNDSMFKRVVMNARVYGEYGVGASTEWVYKNTSAKIVAVDTSNDWARSVLRGKDPHRISVATVDCGAVGAWGRPLSYEFRDRFPTYMERIWMGDSKPDTVLIDGRFRVCCFVTSLLHAARGTQVHLR